METKKLKKLGDFEWKTICWLRKTRPTIYSICRHVSASGMFRRISFYCIKNNEPFCLDWLIAETTGYKRGTKSEGLKVSGCGLDMGFAVVYDFSYQIFPNGFKYHKGESHRNNDISPIDKDGGYALKNRWL